jgi:hypothetical protein
VLKVDRDSLLNDDDLPQACMDALEEHGVLLLRELTSTTRRRRRSAGSWGNSFTSLIIRTPR